MFKRNRALLGFFSYTTWHHRRIMLYLDQRKHLRYIRRQEVFYDTYRFEIQRFCITADTHQGLNKKERNAKNSVLFLLYTFFFLIFKILRMAGLRMILVKSSNTKFSPTKKMIM